MEQWPLAVPVAATGAQPRVSAAMTARLFHVALISTLALRLSAAPESAARRRETRAVLTPGDSASTVRSAVRRVAPLASPPPPTVARDWPVRPVVAPDGTAREVEPRRPVAATAMRESGAG
jgi:hypothetical protein